MVERFNGRVGSEGLGINIHSHRALEQQPRGFNQAYNARRPRVLDGKTPNQVVAEHLEAKPKLANPAPHGRAGPCDATKARLIADRAKEVSQPDSFPAALGETPFHKDVGKAKALLAEAGLASGFEVAMDHSSASPHGDIAQAVQADLGQVGIRVRLLAAEGRQVITKTRARQHQLALLTWGSDYFDPEANAGTFCVNTDNRPEARDRTLA